MLEILLSRLESRIIIALVCVCVGERSARLLPRFRQESNQYRTSQPAPTSPNGCGWFLPCSNARSSSVVVVRRRRCSTHSHADSHIRAHSVRLHRTHILLLFVRGHSLWVYGGRGFVFGQCKYCRTHKQTVCVCADSRIAPRLCVFMADASNQRRLRTRIGVWSQTVHVAAGGRRQSYALSPPREHTLACEHARSSDYGYSECVRCVLGCSVPHRAKFNPIRDARIKRIRQGGTGRGDGVWSGANIFPL